MNEEIGVDDGLQMLFKMQEVLQNNYGYNFENMSQRDILDYLFFNNHSLHMEASECGNEFSWKPWATAEFVNRDALIGELVDVAKFMLNMLLAVGCTSSEFMEKFVLKTAINYARQQNGYTGLEKDENGRALDDPSAA